MYTFQIPSYNWSIAERHWFIVRQRIFFKVIVQNYQAYFIL